MPETLHSSPTPIPLNNHPTHLSSSSPPNHLTFIKPPSPKLHPSLKTQIHPPPPPPPDHTSNFHETILYLDSLGIDAFQCLDNHPPLLSASLSDLRSTLDFLLSLGLTSPALRRALLMCPELLTSPTVIPATTFLLREARVSAPDLPRVIHRRPRLLACSVPRQLRPTLYFLQGTIGIENVAPWASLLSCSVEAKFIPRIDYFQKLRFSYRDTISMFQKFPPLFCYSIQDNFEPKFNYFMVEMGRELKELVAFPQYFSFSLDNRIKLRHGMCVDRGVYLALPTMLKLPEVRFRERLEMCCSSSTPSWKTHDNPLKKGVPFIYDYRENPALLVGHDRCYNVCAHVLATWEWTNGISGAAPTARDRGSTGTRPWQSLRRSFLGTYISYHILQTLLLGMFVFGGRLLVTSLLCS